MIRKSTHTMHTFLACRPRSGAITFPRGPKDAYTQMEYSLWRKKKQQPPSNKHGISFYGFFLRGGQCLLHLISETYNKMRLFVCDVKMRQSRHLDTHSWTFSGLFLCFFFLPNMPIFLPNHRAFCTTSSCINLKHIAMRAMPNRRYSAHTTSFSCKKARLLTYFNLWQYWSHCELSSLIVRKKRREYDQLHLEEEEGISESVAGYFGFII